MKNIFTLGQSLFEVVFSVAIAAIIITAMISLVATNVRNTTQSKDTDLATRYAMEASEWLREQRDKDPDAFFLIADGTYGVPTITATSGLPLPPAANASIAGTSFIRTVQFSSPTPAVREVDIFVRWTDGGIAHETKTRTRFTQWQ